MERCLFNNNPFVPIGLLIGCAAGLAWWANAPGAASGISPRMDRPADGIACSHPYIIDGDTFDCRGTRIRLYGVDAPEMPGHCRPGRQCILGDPNKARDRLTELTRGSVVCDPIEQDVYHRTVARCRSADQDLSCALIRARVAVERYGRLECL